MKYRNSLILFVTALVWGVAFVAQDEGMDYVPPFIFNGVRSLLGGAALLPVIFVKDALSKTPTERWGDKMLIAGGLACGLMLFCASSFQQQGINMFAEGESVGKAGFITAMYIILVPIAGIFIGRRCGALQFAAAFIAAVGLWFLCVPAGGFSVATADILVFCSAVFFTAHIFVIDYFSPKVDGVKMACIQFFTVGALSLVAAPISGETVTVKAILDARLPILYAGVMSCGVGYTLQIVGQKGLNPTVASIIMSLESCISVVAAWLIQGNAMDARQITGCAIMFAAIVLAQLPSPTAKKDKKVEKIC